MVTAVISSTPDRICASISDTYISAVNFSFAVAGRHGRSNFSASFTSSMAGWSWLNVQTRFRKFWLARQGL